MTKIKLNGWLKLTVVTLFLSLLGLGFIVEQRIESFLYWKYKLHEIINTEVPYSFVYEEMSAFVMIMISLILVITGYLKNSMAFIKKVFYSTLVLNISMIVLLSFQLVRNAQVDETIVNLLVVLVPSYLSLIGLFLIHKQTVGNNDKNKTGKAVKAQL